MTCHNRKKSTLNCLDALFKNILPIGFIFKVFLVDDGSIDGTSLAVKEKFAQVNVIKGSGELFWNQGMRLAWQTAVKNDDFDFYIWLNDDTILNKKAIKHLLDCYNEVLLNKKTPVLVTGACLESEENKVFSYGGRIEKENVKPNGDIQYCKYVNGNIVLVSREIYSVIGILSNDYTHGMGDYDYGLRAQENGLLCCTTKEYVAVCPTNKGVPDWCNPSLNLNKRLKSFYSPLGLNIKEYIVFRRKFWGLRWIFFASKAYFKMFSPNLYSKIKL